MTIKLYLSLALGMALSATASALPTMAIPGVSEFAQLENGALPRLTRPELAPTPLSRSEKTTEAAIREAEERFGGRAVGAKPIAGPNGTYHRVRLLQPNGRLRTVTIR